MNCDTFRELVAADPAYRDEQCDEHAAECSGCRAYAERMRNAEWLIHEALRFDVAELRRHADRAGGLRVLVKRRSVWAGVAATLVAALAFWVGVDRGPSLADDLLVAEVLDHWHHEPDSWVDTDVRVSPASLEEVIMGQAAVDANRLGLVSYVRSCYVREQWVPHFVIQGAAGPVMLLLLPGEQISRPVSLDMPEEGLRGVILPLGRGSVAVLGKDGEPLEPIGERVRDAIEWSI